MKIPREARNLSRSLFHAAMAGGSLDKASVSTIATRIASEKPRHYLRTLKEFSRLVRLELAKTHAVVESAVALDVPMRDQLQKELSARFGPSTTFEFTTNPSLIAGMKVRVGSDVWEGSVRNRLDMLRRAA